jgi:hypothetical protein
LAELRRIDPVKVDAPTAETKESLSAASTRR